MAAPAPKLDFKMLIVPAILFFSKKLDMKDPNLVQLLRTGFGTGETTLCFASNIYCTNLFIWILYVQQLSY